MIWLVNINSNQCRIYDYQKRPLQITLLKELDDPAVRHKTSEDLTTERPGLMAHGAYTPHTDPKKNEVDHFLRLVAKELDHGRTHNLYKEIILIAPSHVLGILNQHTDKHIKNLISNSFHRDLIHFKEHELLSFIRNSHQLPF